jgi:serine/threonine protein kinase
VVSLEGDGLDTALARLLLSEQRLPLETLQLHLERARRERSGDEDRPRLALSLLDERLLSPAEIEGYLQRVLPPPTHCAGPRRWEVGTQVGAYILEERVGAGGMGEVFRARHTETGGHVALKTLLEGAEPDEMLRFRREAEALASSAHPQVVGVHTLGQHQGRPYLVTELLSGGDLQKRITAGEPLAPRVAARLVADLAAGIAHAHAQGVLHRDIKPANVLYDERGAVKLVDFGLARLRGGESLTQTGEILGTPAFMAPEQARGDRSQIGEAVDVYGLGALLYACLTGHPPFTEQSLFALLDSVLHDAPPPPSKTVTLDPGLEAICLQALAKSPSDRQSSAQALSDDLGAYLLGSGDSPRRRPWLLAVAMLLLTAAGLVAFLQEPGRTVLSVPSPESTRALRPAAKVSPSAPDAERPVFRPPVLWGRSAGPSATQPDQRSRVLGPPERPFWRAALKVPASRLGPRAGLAYHYSTGTRASNLFAWTGGPHEVELWQLRLGLPHFSSAEPVEALSGSLRAPLPVVGLGFFRKQVYSRYAKSGRQDAWTLGVPVFGQEPSGELHPESDARVGGMGNVSGLGAISARVTSREGAFRTSHEGLGEAEFSRDWTCEGQVCELAVVGRVVAAGTVEGKVHYWKGLQGARRTLDLSAAVEALAVSRGGRGNAQRSIVVLVSSARGLVRWFPRMGLQKAVPVPSGFSLPLRQLSFVGKSQRLALALGKDLWATDLVTGRWHLIVPSVLAFCTLGGGGGVVGVLREGGVELWDLRRMLGGAFISSLPRLTQAEVSQEAEDALSKLTDGRARRLRDAAAARGSTKNPERRVLSLAGLLLLAAAGDDMALLQVGVRLTKAGDAEKGRRYLYQASLQGASGAAEKLSDSLRNSGRGRYVLGALWRLSRGSSRSLSRIRTSPWLPRDDVEMNAWLTLAFDGKPWEVR